MLSKIPEVLKLYFFCFLLMVLMIQQHWKIQAEMLFERLLCISYGEGNGNPLQCSCLENPRDGGAWWAAVYGVAESRT